MDEFVAEMTKAARVMGELTMYKALLVKDLNMENPLPSNLKAYIIQGVKQPVADKPPYKDFWGNDYLLIKKGPRSFRLASPGPDGRMGTDDDIAVGYDG